MIWIAIENCLKWSEPEKLGFISSLQRFLDTISLLVALHELGRSISFRFNIIIYMHTMCVLQVIHLIIRNSSNNISRNTSSVVLTDSWNVDSSKSPYELALKELGVVEGVWAGVCLAVGGVWDGEGGRGGVAF